MGKVKKSFKIFSWTIFGIFGFVILYGVAMLLISRIMVNSDVAQTNDGITVYILTNGVHTDIVVPLKNEISDWSKSVLIENTKAKDYTAEYVAFGWGDKGFYLETPTWGDLKASTALKAATGLSSSAIHATFYKRLTENESCKKVTISKDDYSKLVAYINDSFVIENGNFIKVPTSYTYGKNDAFYEAKGSYSLFYTCNSWANQALKSANQKSALWTIFDKGIFCHYN